MNRYCAAVIDVMRGARCVCRVVHDVAFLVNRRLTLRRDDTILSLYLLFWI